MEHSMIIGATVRFIESRVKEAVDYAALEKAIGLSYRQIREEFKRYTGISLGRYINTRKIANIAFEMETTDHNLMYLATEYGFDVYDTFTRAFKREVGMTPNQYRRSHQQMAQRKLIGMGTYAPVLVNSLPEAAIHPLPAADGTILYGVPKLEYAGGKCTPFPACLEHALSYIGQRENCSYPWLMAASGAAFRLLWNPGRWDMSNSNLMNMNPRNPWDAFERVCRAAGWSCKVITRDQHTIDDFKAHIIDNISKGIPVIALGVIGPPEACLITGYQQDAAFVMGWNYFQDNPEFMTDAEVMETGYFLTSNWWENSSTIALITLGETGEAPSLKAVLQQIHWVMSMEESGQYMAGNRAFDAWAQDISNDTLFQENSVTPILLTQFMCQTDTETMLCEGRYWGAEFFQGLGETDDPHARDYAKIAKRFHMVSECARQMTAVRKADQPTEEAVRLLCQKETRREIAALIRKAQREETKARQMIQSIADQLS